jgi:hypothetical protein
LRANRVVEANCTSREIWFANITKRKTSRLILRQERFVAGLADVWGTAVGTAWNGALDAGTVVGAFVAAVTVGASPAGVSFLAFYAVVRNRAIIVFAVLDTNWCACWVVLVAYLASVALGSSDEAIT